MSSTDDINDVQILWVPPPGTPTSFPCVDCGLMTGNFCDGGIFCAYDQCFASEKIPADYGSNGKQRTPLYSYCETRFVFFRFCHKEHGCTPPTTCNHWSNVPPELSRQFTPQMAKLAIAKQWQDTAKKEGWSCVPSIQLCGNTNFLRRATARIRRTMDILCHDFPNFPWHSSLVLMKIYSPSQHGHRRHHYQHRHYLHSDFLDLSLVYRNTGLCNSSSSSSSSPSSSSSKAAVDFLDLSPTRKPI